MSDRLTLSCWLRNFTPLSANHHWEKLLQLFPYSQLSQGISALRVHAISWNEPVVFEQLYPHPLDLAAIIQDSHEFTHEDAAWQLETSWDLMRLDEDDDWHLQPVPVSLWCFAPGFENESSDHIRIEFGLEDTFLPQDGEAGIRASQANLRSLMHLVKDISAKLPVERQHLWSESGTNFAQKLAGALAEGASGLALQ